MNFNSIVGYIKPKAGEVHESIGITKQPQGDEDSWAQIIGGLIFQGGKVAGIAFDAVTVITFSAAYPKKVLGVFLEPINGTITGAAAHSHAVNNVTLTQFDLVNDSGVDEDYYWWAIGY